MEKNYKGKQKQEETTARIVIEKELNILIKINFGQKKTRT